MTTTVKTSEFVTYSIVNHRSISEIRIEASEISDYRAFESKDIPKLIKYLQVDEDTAIKAINSNHFSYRKFDSDNRKQSVYIPVSPFTLGRIIALNRDIEIIDDAGNYTITQQITDGILSVADIVDRENKSQFIDVFSFSMVCTSNIKMSDSQLKYGAYQKLDESDYIKVMAI